MPSVESLTITLPNNLIKDMDRRNEDRGKFIVEAVRRELERRRSEELGRSLESPHPESLNFADRGLEAWSLELPDEDVGSLVDTTAGTPVRWLPGDGWVEG